MKKVILTEWQLKNLVNTEKIKEFLLKYIFEDAESLDLIKRNIKYCLRIGIGAAMLVTVINLFPNINNDTKEELTEFVQEETTNNNDKLTDDDNEKINAVTSYIEFALNKKGYNMNNLLVTPSEFVLQAKKHNYDLPLLLAQAHLESCFGMTPRARKTNSIFSIGSYDNGTNHAVYGSQDDSIEDYIRVMQNDYLTGDTDVSDLLATNAFRNGAGNRYASDKNYEAKVKRVRNRIIQMYPELK